MLPRGKIDSVQVQAVFRVVHDLTLNDPVIGQEVVPLPVGRRVLQVEVHARVQCLHNQAGLAVNAGTIIEEMPGWRDLDAPAAPDHRSAAGQPLSLFALSGQRLGRQFPYRGLLIASRLWAKYAK